MSLLSVTVKKARYVGAQASQFNTYVTLKLQNVKSTTVTVKGATPCWEQDFLFETNDLNSGLLIEVWSKGMIWDRAMGYNYIPLQSVQFSNEEGNGQWLSLEAELVMRDGKVVGTKNATGHSLLVDCRFELPFDPENIEASDLQRKLEMLNNIMDQEARLEQARRQMQYIGHSGYSEDSDYTSDLNYPVGQHANSSASQFRSAAHQIHTPQRSLETSRENSYERDDAPGHQHHLSAPTTHQNHLSPGSHRRHHQRYSPGTEDYNYPGSNSVHNVRHYQDNNTDFDPLFYNSRPRNKPDYSRRRKYEWDNQESQETWASCETSFYNQSLDSTDTYSVDSQYYNSNHHHHPRSKARRPSLERQSTLYDDSTYYGDSVYYPNDNVTQVNCVEMSSQHFNQNQSYDEYYDSLSYPFQEEEDRQWDSGGYTAPPPKSNTKKLPSIPAVQNHMSKRRSSINFDEYYDEPYRSTPTVRRKMPQIPTKRSASRQSSINDDYRTHQNSSHRGASLPPTPTKTPKVLPQITTQKLFNSLPPTPGRQLPKLNLNHRSAKTKRNNLMKRTSSAEYNEIEYDYYERSGAVSAREMYNEDYNYAYQSYDNLPTQHEGLEVNRIQEFSDRNTDAVMNAKNDGYFNSGYDNHLDYHNEMQETVRKKKLGQRDISPLLQHNMSSIESHDDFKDSFETAVSLNSSINHNSLNQVKKIADVITPNNTTPITSKAQSTTTATTTTTTHYQRDQQSPPKAIATVPQPMVQSIPPQLPQAPTTTQTPYKAQTRGLLKQQDSVDLNQTSVVNSCQDIFHDAYLEPQDSVESYVEEEEGDTEPPPKAISHDSVIQAGYGEDLGLRRGSSQITVIDPYHPSHDYASRRPSVAGRRTSGDAFPSTDDSFAHKTAIAESRRVSPTQNGRIPEDLQLPEMTDEDLPEKKSVSFEEEEESKPRPKITAQQRWLWAYNKIIMQLNVSEQLSPPIDR